MVGPFSKAESFADIDKLNTPVDPRSRVHRIAQLFFAEAHRLKYAGINPKGIYQSIPDGLGAPLTQVQIVLATANRIGMADHQDAIAKQYRIMQGIGYGTDVAV